MSEKHVTPRGDSPANRIDSLCDAFEADWASGQRPRIEELLTKVPETQQPVLLYELLAVELECFHRRGEKPALDEYLRRLPATAHVEAIANLFSCATTTMVVVANDEAVDADFIEAADTAGLPLLASPLAIPKVIDHLQHYLTRALAARTSLHGVYMEVMGMGVFITGEAGIGKSELALELLSRNHRLIADDAVEFSRTAPTVLLGRCPRMLCDFLEVRGLGILNVRAMFGDTAVRKEKTLRLIVRLEPLHPQEMARIDRLQAEQKTRNILDVDIPEVVLYVAPGRNLAVLVEAATRSHILRLRGINPLDELMKRQQASMNQDGA